MNFFDKNNKLFCSVYCHKKCIIKTIDYENIIYDYDKYNELLDFIENKLSSKDKKDLLNYLKDNSEFVSKSEALKLNKPISKRKKKIDPSQTSLF